MAIVNKHWQSIRRIFIDNMFLTTIVCHYQSTQKSGVKGCILCFASSSPLPSSPSLSFPMLVNGDPYPHLI